MLGGNLGSLLYGDVSVMNKTITLTRLYRYVIYCGFVNFPMKNCFCFVPAQTINCGYSLEPPHRVESPHGGD